MEKRKFRVLIKHYFLRRKSIKKTEEKLAKYYKEFSPSHGMDHKWFNYESKEVTFQEMFDNDRTQRSSIESA